MLLVGGVIDLVDWWVRWEWYFIGVLMLVPVVVVFGGLWYIACQGCVKKTKRSMAWWWLWRRVQMALSRRCKNGCADPCWPSLRGRDCRLPRRKQWCPEGLPRRKQWCPSPSSRARVMHASHVGLWRWLHSLLLVEPVSQRAILGCQEGHEGQSEHRNKCNRCVGQTFAV